MTSIRHIPGELGRMFVASRSNPHEEHLVDVLEDSCGCAAYTMNHRRYKQETGRPFRCWHLREAREAFLNELIDGLKEAHLSR